MGVTEDNDFMNNAFNEEKYFFKRRMFDKLVKDNKLLMQSIGYYCILPLDRRMGIPSGYPYHKGVINWEFELSELESEFTKRLLKRKHMLGLNGNSFEEMCKTYKEPVVPPVSRFMKPVYLSKKLSDFLGFEDYTCLTIPQITKSVLNYIKDNNLQLKSNKRLFYPDSKLAEVIGSPMFCTQEHAEQELGYTYGELQKQLATHIFNNHP